ncbi:autotransporter outer membrane beta-barrel domain-containing protein [Campylobacter fetus]|uniref:autotransporter outer membrane beta-barrel domain-containing protein n=1 Tax=Campylobacter fetus TaxID=196 RepID=UPI000818B144|nr:autotransporter outer membrane beta-barrel domain-containing protein [Campylobacter fetus]
MSDTSGATHKLLLATSLVLINSLFAGETLTYDYSGGGSTTGTAPSTITINGRPYFSTIAPSDTSLSDNVVTILSTDIFDTINVFGGYSDTGDVENNIVNISGVAMDTSQDIYGGHSQSGSTNSNTVNISGGTINNNVYGGYSQSGSTNSNTVNISGGTINNNVYGGYSETVPDSVNSNTVNISDGIINSNVYGGKSYSGSVTNNTVNILGGTISNVFGGSTINGSGSANLNIVNISGGTIGKDVYGGYSDTGSAANNTINISSGTISGNVYGGFNSIGRATNNTVTISGNPDFGTDTIIYGGDRVEYKGDVTTGNTLNIETLNLRAKDIKNFENINFYTSQDTTAGETLLNLTSVADVNISNSNIAVGVKQGDTPTLKVGDEITLIDRSGKTINLPTSMMNSAIADMNSSYTFTLGGVPKDTTSTDISKLVAVFGVTTYNPGNVAAANGTIYYSNTAPASGSIKPNSINDNVVSIYSTNSDVDNVYGGYSDTEVAERNTVNIYGGTISRNIYGSYTAYKDKVANRNTINIFGGTISHDIYGGFSFSGSAMINTVNISGGTINNSVYGGTGSGEMSRNTVNISGGAISKFVYGGSSTGSGSANLNIVNISGGTIGKDVYGGYGGNGPNKISADSNTINISGGDIRENIYGGYIINGSSVTKNTVTISKNPTSGNPTFGTNTIIYGGHSRDNSSADVTTGNTLNIKTSNLEVKDIANFEFINFYLDNSIKADDTLLTLNDAGPTDLSNSKIGVGVISGDTPVLNSNDKIILIDKPNGSLISPNDMSNNIQVMQGISNSYEFTLSTVDSGGDIKKIVASLTPPSTPVIIPPPYVPPTPITPVEPIEPDKEPEVPVIPTEPDPAEPVIEPEVPVQPVTPYTINEKQKAVLEGGFVSSLMLNNSNQALESGLQDMSQALNASGANETSIGNTNVSSTRNKTGSHVDVKSISLLVGFAKKANDSFMYSAFFEAGFGNYDSYNNFSTGDIKGSGDSSYYGFGVLSKFDMINNYYFENSLRVGQIKSDFSSDDFGIATPISSSFDSKRYYIGAHIGLGKIINLNNSSNLDIYTKVFYTRVDSEDITMSTNDRFRLDAINSVSAKLGFLYNYELKENLSLYSGASFSKEFNAEAKGRNISYNYDLDSPSMKGNTRSLEAGIKLKPISNNDKLSLDLGIVGLVGKSEGVSGKFGFKWKL